MLRLMIESGRASFVVTSTDTEPQVVSDILGLEPSEVIPKGTVLRSGRVREHHTWSIDVDNRDNTEEDQTGTRPLRELLDSLRRAAGQVAGLPNDCEARLWWYGSSDSTQGGFVLPADLARDIAALGVDLYATVYLDDGYNPDA
jgi:hypothetical protein